jgi:hypothetical protein
LWNKRHQSRGTLKDLHFNSVAHIALEKSVI